MNRRDLFRLAGAVAVAPRAIAPVVAAPPGHVVSGIALQELYRTTQVRSLAPSSRLLFLVDLRRAGIIGPPMDEEDDDAT